MREPGGCKEDPLGNGKDAGGPLWPGRSAARCTDAWWGRLWPGAPHRFLRRAAAAGYRWSVPVAHDDDVAADARALALHRRLEAARAAHLDPLLDRHGLVPVRAAR